MSRMQRRMHFLPSILGQTIPGLAALLLVWPFYLAFGDYRVMVFAILTQVMLGVTASHLLAERRFRVGFDPAIMRRSLSFGWPIMLNGMLLFVVLHGEKLVVGRELGMEALAIFAMGFTLSLTPLSVMARSFNQFFLPQLSGAAGDPARFNRIARVNFQAHFLCAVLFAAFLTFFGPGIVHLLLGEAFAALGPLMAWLGILNAFRLLKGASALTAFSLARTGNAFWGNLPRVAALPLAWYVLIMGGDLVMVIWIGLLAEALGFLVSLMLLWRQPVFQLRPLWGTFAVNIALLGTLAAGAGLHLLPAPPEWAAPVSVVLAGLLLIGSLFVAHDLRAYIGQRKWRRR